MSIPTGWVGSLKVLQRKSEKEVKGTLSLRAPNLFFQNLFEILSKLINQLQMHSSHIFNVSQTQKQSIMRSSLFLLIDRNDTLESNFQINAHRCACCEWSRKVYKWLNFYLVSKISTDLNSCEICELYFSSFFSF